MLIIVGFAPRHLVASQDVTYSVRLLIEMVQRSTSLNSFEISTVGLPNGRSLSRFHGSRPAAAQGAGVSGRNRNEVQLQEGA